MTKKKKKKIKRKANKKEKKNKTKKDRKWSDTRNKYRNITKKEEIKEL